MTAPKRFCAPAGHDTLKLGRYPGGNCAECSRIRSRQWAVDNPGRVRTRNLQRLYGITDDQYEAMLASQGGVCFVCGVEPKPNRRLSVDHNHRTGKVRKLLCDRCNRVLGLCDEEPKLLGTLAMYAQGDWPEWWGSEWRR